MKQVQDTFDILYNYLLSEATGKDNDLLESWASKVIKSGDHGFEKGLLGLGWLIAFLIDNNYIEGDADEILEDIDDTLYKLTIKEVLDPFVHIPQLLHHVSYYQQRLQCDSPRHFYRQFAHFECIKLLLEKLNKLLLQSHDTVSAHTISDRVNIVLKYSYLTKTCVNEKLIEEAFYHTIEGLIDFFENSHEFVECEEDLAKLYICVKQYEHPYWIGRIEHIYAHKAKRNQGIENNQEIPSFWANIRTHITDWKAYFNGNGTTSKTDKINLYHYCTNIKQVHQYSKSC